MTKDIVLITIDALRHDVTDQMPNTNQFFPSIGRREAITAGAATNWVFPAVLAGSYYTRAYNESGVLRNDFPTLPDLLGAEGYSTGAFLGFNPYLAKWEGRFDEFWNGGLSGGDEQWYSNPVSKWVSRLRRTVLLRKRVSADEVIDRARRWYNDQEGARFLWIHLMEPHKPYYPGLSHALDLGLFRTYRSIARFQRDGSETSREYVRIQRRLYERCVREADTALKNAFNFIADDATVVLLGDHGEEFDHGYYGHERLYDECVRVPFFSRGLLNDDPRSTVRQIDIGAELLSARGLSVPDEWDSVAGLGERPSLMMTPRPSEGTFQCAIRTSKDKLIRTYDRDTGDVLETEYYDLVSDPSEMNNRYGSADIDGRLNELEEFMTAHRNALSMEPETGQNSETVDERLKNLGYK